MHKGKLLCKVDISDWTVDDLHRMLNIQEGIEYRTWQIIKRSGNKEVHYHQSAPQPTIKPTILP
jgi:hypothetical protein